MMNPFLIVIVMSIRVCSESVPQKDYPLVIWYSHWLIYWKRGVVAVKAREFVYAGDPVSEINEQEYAAFFMNMQRAVLLSLEKRSLLTASQRERCIAALEKQYNQEVLCLLSNMNS